MRIPEVPNESITPEVQSIFDWQKSTYGAVLEPYKLFARRPSILKTVVSMWGAIDESGLIPQDLKTLINLRVATLNQCEF